MNLRCDSSVIPKWSSPNNQITVPAWKIFLGVGYTIWSGKIRPSRIALKVVGRGEEERKCNGSL